MKNSLVSSRVLLVVVLALTTALAVAASPAAAQRPSMTVTPIDITFIDNTLCPFPIVERVQGTQIDKIFFDDGGQAVLLQRHINIQATLTNPETGTVLTGRQATMIQLDLTTNESTVHGALIVTVPGQGVVLLDAGKYMRDAAGNVVWEAGKHQLIHGDLERFCAAMS